MTISSFRSRLALIAVSASLVLAVSGCGNITGSTSEETSNSDASIIDTSNLDNTGAEGSDTESPNVDSPTTDAPGEEDTSSDDTGVEENSGEDTDSGEPSAEAPNTGGTSNSSSSSSSSSSSCPQAPSSFESKGSKGSDAGLSESGKYALSLIGYQEAKAEACAKEAGFSWRVIFRDGESFPGTKDYRFDRINAAIANGLVIFASVG